jgi:hypothetical protein
MPHVWYACHSLAPRRHYSSNVAIGFPIVIPFDAAEYQRARRRGRLPAEPGNASAAVTDAVRRVLPDARRARQRAAAQAFGEYIRTRTPQEIERDRALIESSNDLALRDATW